MNDRLFGILGDDPRLGPLLECFGEGLWILDAQGNTSFATERMCAIVGRLRENTLGRPAEELVVERSRERFRHALSAVQSGEQQSFELSLLHADGREVWVAIRMTLVDAAGEVMVTVNDITERLRNENAIRRNEAHYRALVEAAPDHILILSSAGLVEFLGRGEGDLVGASFLDWVEGDARDHVEAAILRALDLGTVVSEELAARLFGGDLRRYVCRFRRIDDRFGPDRVVVFMTDVTDIKRVEAELAESQRRLLEAQRAEVIGRLASGLAHDFDNLLSVVGGSARFVSSGLGPDDPLQEDVQQILAATARAETVTRQLLAFRRAQPVRPRRIDLSEAVRAMQRMLDRLLGEHVLLRVELGERLPKVLVDPGEAEQMLLNLVTTAREALAGGGTITVRTFGLHIDPEEAAMEGIACGTYIAMSVTDSGPGLDEEALAHVFEPFARYGESTDGGLLLSSVRATARRADGTVRVESRKGRGTTFTVLLPAARIDGATTTPPECGGATVLVVEDDGQVRTVLEKSLRRAGHRVLVADGATHALEIAESHQGEIDLLLTDLVMPGMSGAQLARCIEPFRPKMRVLYVTGYLDDTAKRHGLAHGARDVVTKPFTPEGIVRAVATALAR